MDWRHEEYQPSKILQAYYATGQDRRGLSERTRFIVPSIGSSKPHHTARELLNKTETSSKNPRVHDTVSSRSSVRIGMHGVITMITTLRAWEVARTTVQHNKRKPWRKVRPRHLSALRFSRTNQCSSINQGLWKELCVLSLSVRVAKTLTGSMTALPIIETQVTNLA